MTTDLPPRKVSHLRVFACSLAVVAVSLTGFLFGVNLEAIAPANGTITARDLTRVRTGLAGLVEPGWHEGYLSRPGGPLLAVRMDGQGNGRLDPAAGEPHEVFHAEWTEDGRRSAVQQVRWHHLQPGDELWPAQVLAVVRNDDLRDQLGHLDDQIKDQESHGENPFLLRRDRDRIRERLNQGILRVPATGDRWQVVAVGVEHQQAVQPGDVVATVVPLDPHTGQPRDLRVRLAVEEKHWADLQPGQLVRLQSAVHNHRLHGYADGQLDHLEPAADSDHHLHAEAAVTASPFSLPLGSSVQAEVVVGRKPVYRLILEH